MLYHSGIFYKLLLI